MCLAVLDGLPTSAVPLLFWPWILGALLLVGGIGVVLGAFVAWFFSRSRLKRALTDPAKLLPMVKEQLEAASTAAAALKNQHQLVLSEEETAELSSRRDSLLDTLTEVVELQQQVAATLRGQPLAKKGSASTPFEIAWRREPVDEETKLPNAVAVSENVNAMLALGTDHQRESGVLFIKIDGFEKLAHRHGTDGRETLLRKFAGVVIRSVREADLVCRYDADTLAVLFPSLEEGRGPVFADTVRKSVLSHQFRLSESGPSVIVNAHYGYSDCLPHENEDLVLNRAGNALAKSESKGCNQLHIHNGDSLLHLASRH